MTNREAQKYLDNFKHNCRKKRKAKNLTVRELGLRINVCHGTITNYEIGIRFPLPHLFIRLCNALDTSPNELLGYPT